MTVAVSPNSSRTLITLSNDVKAKLTKLAKKDNDNFSNFARKILNKYAEENTL